MIFFNSKAHQISFQEFLKLTEDDLCKVTAYCNDSFAACSMHHEKLFVR